MTYQQGQTPTKKANTTTDTTYPIITNRQGTSYYVLDEITPQELHNIKIDDNRCETVINSFHPDIKVNPQDLKPLITKLQLLEFKGKSKRNTRCRSNRLFCDLNVLSMFKYSKHIHLYHLQNIEKGWKKWGVFIDVGYEINHIDGNPNNNLIGNLECVPIWLNQKDYELRVMVNAGKIPRTTADKLISKYKNLPNNLNLEKQFDEELKSSS